MIYKKNRDILEKKYFNGQLDGSIILAVIIGIITLVRSLNGGRPLIIAIIFAIIFAGAIWACGWFLLVKKVINEWIKIDYDGTFLEVSERQVHFREKMYNSFNSYYIDYKDIREIIFYEDIKKKDTQIVIVISNVLSHRFRSIDKENFENIKKEINEHIKVVSGGTV